MSFLDFLSQNQKRSMKIFDDTFLNEGECINISGGPYVGKTTFCFYLVKQNKDMKIAYVQSESLSPKYQRKLKSISNNIYLIECFDIDKLKEILQKFEIDAVIIDSLTAMAYIDHKKKLMELFDIILNKKANMVIVSQTRNAGEQKYYEHKKLLNFLSYNFEIEKESDEMIINKELRIKYNEIWKN
jgi:predicted ATP-dependent serine protease